jgi:hypothetical protein
MKARDWFVCWGLGLGLLAGCSGADAGASNEESGPGSVSQQLTQACQVDADCRPAVTGQICAPSNVCVSPAACYTASGSGVVTGDVVIDDVDTEEDLAKLQGAWCVTGNITVKNAPLFDLSGFEGLVAVGNTLTVQDSPLFSMNGLQNLRRLLKISLFRNPYLASLDGMPRLSTLASLQVYQNPGLSDLRGLYGVTAISWAEVVANRGLTSLGGLDSLTTVYGYLDIRQNPKLETLRGLGNVKSVGNLLQVMDNPGLLDLGGMDALKTVGTLRVMRNTALETVTDMPVLGSSRTFQVSDNPNLDSCELSEVAARANADCSGCARNGACGPRLSLRVVATGDNTVFDSCSLGNGTIEAGDVVSVYASVKNRSTNSVTLSPARLTSSDPFVIRTAEQPFPWSPLLPGSSLIAVPTAQLGNDAAAGAVIQDRVEVDWSVNGQSGTLSRNSQINVAYSGSSNYHFLEISCGMGDRLPINGTGALDNRFVPGETLDQVLAIRNRESTPLTVTSLRIVPDQPAFQDLTWGVEPGTIVAPEDSLFIDPTLKLAADASPQYVPYQFELTYEIGGISRTELSAYTGISISAP